MTWRTYQNTDCQALPESFCSRLDWGLTICVFHKFLVEADAADVGNGDGPSLPESTWQADGQTEAGSVSGK